MWFEWHHALLCACSHQSSKGRWYSCQGIRSGGANLQMYVTRSQSCKGRCKYLLLQHYAFYMNCRAQDREVVVVTIEGSRPGGKYQKNVKIWFTIYVCQLR
jgi:hypothetical protein